jgi:hypothetical protein
VGRDYPTGVGDGVGTREGNGVGDDDEEMAVGLGEGGGDGMYVGSGDGTILSAGVCAGVGNPVGCEGTMVAKLWEVADRFGTWC